MEEEKKEALVIHYFFTENDNSQKHIASLTGLQIQKVSRILNKHLKNKYHESKP